MWRRLPLVSGPLPSVLAALEGGAAAAPAAAFDASDFGAWVARGNPWREPAHEDGEDGEAAAGLESLGPETLEGTGASAEREDDEEAAELYGESIDEESQRVRVRAGAPRHGDDSTPVVTHASWRLARCEGTLQRVLCSTQVLARQLPVLPCPLRRVSKCGQMQASRGLKAAFNQPSLLTHSCLV